MEDGNTKYDSRDDCNAIIFTQWNQILTGCKNTSIPSSVTSIGSKAFYGCTGLTSITIPDNIETIGIEAFLDCSGLTSISISNSIQSIGNGAFCGCTGLMSFDIPNSITTIEGRLLYGCTSLKSLFIPSNITLIQDGAFGGCTGLMSIQVDDANQVYDSRDNCNAIIETRSDKVLFGFNTSVIPNSVRFIAEYAFRDCSSLESIVISENVKEIGFRAFYNCSSLSSVIILSNVETIGGDAFYNCSSLSSIIIPGNVKTIGSGAFYGCSSLSSITLSEREYGPYIGNNAFTGCHEMTNFYCKSKQVPSVTSYSDTSSCFYDSSYETATLWVPASSLLDYMRADPWNKFGKIEEIEDGYFYDKGSNNNLLFHIISEDEKTCEIAKNSKKFNGNLEILDIPEKARDYKVIGIADSAFCDFENINDITIPANIEYIGKGAFRNNNSLIRVNSKITEPFAIDNSAFFFGDDFFTNANLYVPKGTKAKYMATEGWKKFKRIMEEGTYDGTKPADAVAVDLGLPSGTKWANMNVGATTPEGYGDYFAWGETVAKDYYWSDNYKYYELSDGDKYLLTKYCTKATDGVVDNVLTLESTDDAATANWGGKWRMPTSEEIEELLNNCGWVLTTKNGVKGYLVTGSNGNSIFLPLSGLRHSVFYGIGKQGLYWSSSLNQESDISTSRNSYSLTLYETFKGCGHDERIYGFAVRPVLSGDVGDEEPATFTFQTTEGVEMTFVITNEEPKTCAVYSQTIASGTTGTVTIPETANGYSVTGIGKNAFKGCASVTSITIPATIKEIGDSAFFGCTALTEVHSLVLEPFAISDNVFMVSDGVFTSATLHVPAGTKAKYETTAGWKQFKSVVENGTAPGDDIDPSKGWLTLVDKKLKRLNSAKGEWMMFQSNGYLVKGEEGREYNSLSDAHIDPNDPSVLLFDFNPGTYKKVAFRSDGAVKMLDEKHLSEMVPEGTYTIADGTDCYDHIGDNTFRAKTDEGVLMRFKVTDEENNTCQVFTISEQGERMGWAWATSISDQTTGTVTIPSVANGYTVTEIGEYAFWPCSQVTTFIVPETVTTIGKEAFRGCTSIADFYIYATTVPSTDRIFEYKENNLSKGYATIPSATLHVPAGTKEDYAAVEPWSAFGMIVVIGEEETDVVIVDELMYLIGNDGTAALTGLKSGLSGEVIIPEVIIVDGNTYPVTEIAAGAFKDCDQMTSIVIPASVTVIGASAFAGCSGLKDIYCNNPIPADLGLANTRSLGGTATDIGNVPSQFEGVDVSACVLHVPEGSVDLYRTTLGWSCFKNLEAMNIEGVVCIKINDPTSASWYMLNGSRIMAKPTHKGIYIHTGKKYIVR